MNIGDQVRLIRVPPDLPIGDTALPTEATFRTCLGHVFTVVGFKDIGWAELLTEPVTGNVGETIWVEQEYLELVSK